MQFRKWLASGSLHIVLIGNLAGQGSLLIVTPALTRIYTPDDFGIYQLGFFVGALVLPLSTLRVEQIIPRLGSEGEVVFWLRRAYTLLLSIVALIVILSAVMPHSKWPGFTEVALIAAGLLLASAVTVLDNATLLFRQDYRRLGARNFLSGFLGAAAQILAGIWWPSPVSLGLALAFGRLLSIGLTIDWSHFRTAKPTNSAGAYPLSQRFFAIATGTLSTSSLQLPATMFVAGAGLNIGGQVTMAQRLAGTPSSLVAQGLAQIVSGICGKNVRESRPGLYDFLKRFVFKLILLGTVVVGGLVAVLFNAHELLLGPGWETMAQAAGILAPLFLLQLVVSPITVVLALLGEQKVFFGFECVRTIFVAGSVIIAFALTSNHVAVLLVWTVSGGISYMFLLGLVLNRARRFDSSVRAMPGRLQNGGGVYPS